MAFIAEIPFETKPIGIRGTSQDLSPPVSGGNSSRRKINVIGEHLALCYNRLVRGD
jgi:hypothetical protein